jgi:hypothetical protein
LQGKKKIGGKTVATTLLRSGKIPKQHMYRGESVIAVSSKCHIVFDNLLMKMWQSSSVQGRKKLVEETVVIELSRELLNICQKSI